MFSVVLYESSRTLCEYSLRVFKNRILWTAFQSKREKTGNVRIQAAQSHVRVTTVVVKKQNVLHILCVCVCLQLWLFSQEWRMRCFIFSYVACPAIQYFWAFSHKWHDFRENVIKHKSVFFIFFTTVSEIFLTVRITQPDTITNVHKSSCKVSVIPVAF